MRAVRTHKASSSVRSCETTIAVPVFSYERMTPAPRQLRVVQGESAQLVELRVALLPAPHDAAIGHRPHPARAGRELAGDQAQQCGLSGTVCAHEPREPRVERAGHPLEQGR
jgi:hypothetical protein